MDENLELRIEVQARALQRLLANFPYQPGQSARKDEPGEEQSGPMIDVVIELEGQPLTPEQIEFLDRLPGVETYYVW